MPGIYVTALMMKCCNALSRRGREIYVTVRELSNRGGRFAGPAPHAQFFRNGGECVVPSGWMVRVRQRAAFATRAGAHRHRVEFACAREVIEHTHKPFERGKMVVAAITECC